MKFLIQYRNFPAINVVTKEYPTDNYAEGLRMALEEFLSAERYIIDVKLIEDKEPSPCKK